MRTFDGVLDDLEHDGFGHWLAGFIDGEGSFVIAKTGGRHQSATGPSYGCRLQVKLRDDDAAILYEAQERTGLGRVGAEKVYARSGRDMRNTNPQMLWKVASQAECAKLVRLFERFPLRAKKRADFELWRLAVREWQAKGRYGHWDRMAALHRQIMQSRRYVAADDDSPEAPEAAPNVLPLFGEPG